MTDVAAPDTPRAPALPRWAVRRATRERRWTRGSLYLGLAILAIVILSSLLAPLLGLSNPNHEDYNAVLLPPSWAHLFGTDSVGRDVFSRTVYAGRLDLGVGLLLTGLSVSVGVPLGAAAGYFGGPIDAVIMRTADLVLTFPALVLILAVVSIFGPGLTGIVVGAPLIGWALYARLTRAEMLVVKQRDFIHAARTLGYSTPRIIARHAVPNVWRPALVFSMADIVLNIGALATLSYLGVGVQPPTPEWGAIIAGGQVDIYQAWWISTLPGVVLVMTGVGLVLVGDALADILHTGGAG